ncbi:MAG: hypothetical protein EPO28_02310 [Saprospiraceae bacterium]|nr:MAG: hypothetical protein EPO28_02310 [Saprospiraceae bacterium]
MAISIACPGNSGGGKGRALDNVFVERPWRSVKYEDIYLHEYANGLELFDGFEKYFYCYNDERKHKALDFKTPAETFFFGPILKPLTNFCKFENHTP